MTHCKVKVLWLVCKGYPERVLRSTYTGSYQCQQPAGCFTGPARSATVPALQKSRLRPESDTSLT